MGEFVREFCGMDLEWRSFVVDPERVAGQLEA